MTVESELLRREQMFCPRCETGYDTGAVCPKDSTKLIRIGPQVDAMIGRVIDERFTIVERLGQGGMGAVYRATREAGDGEVAIKVIHPNLIGDSEAIRRFVREARLASKLNHPNAVAILDFGQTHDGMLFLVMEMLAGLTLEQVLDATPVQAPRRVIDIGVQICDALEAAHGLAIVHRDLKPANIMLSVEPELCVKVLDFGLAKSMANDESNPTLSGMLHGTPSYIAPERARGLPGDQRSDLYSLGCMLYLAAAGHPAFSAATPHEMLLAQAFSAVPPLTNVPPALAKVIETLMAKDPDKRFANACDTRIALLGAALDEMPAAPREPSIRVPRMSELAHSDTMYAAVVGGLRRRWQWVGASAGALVIVLALFVLRGESSTATAGVPAPAVELAPAPAPLVVLPAPPPVEVAYPTLAPPVPMVPPAPAVAPVTKARPTTIARKPKLPF